MTSKIWFITGTSRGDKVAATTRTVADVADLKERFGDAVLRLALDVLDADQARHAVR